MFGQFLWGDQPALHGRHATLQAGAVRSDAHSQGAPIVQSTDGFQPFSDVVRRLVATHEAGRGSVPALQDLPAGNRKTKDPVQPEPEGVVQHVDDDEDAFIDISDGTEDALDNLVVSTEPGKPDPDLAHSDSVTGDIALVPDEKGAEPADLQVGFAPQPAMVGSESRAIDLPLPEPGALPSTSVAAGEPVSNRSRVVAAMPDSPGWHGNVPTPGIKASALVEAGITTGNLPGPEVSDRQEPLLRRLPSHALPAEAMTTSASGSAARSQFATEEPSLASGQSGKAFTRDQIQVVRPAMHIAQDPDGRPARVEGLFSGQLVPVGVGNGSRPAQPDSADLTQPASSAVSARDQSTTLEAIGRPAADGPAMGAATATIATYAHETGLRAAELPGEMPVGPSARERRGSAKGYETHWTATPSPNTRASPATKAAEGQVDVMPFGPAKAAATNAGIGAKATDRAALSEPMPLAASATSGAEAAPSRGGSLPTPQTTMATPPPPTQQIAVALSQNRGRETTEIRLEPEELGRVVMSLRGDERGLVLQITAERQDTLDLIRRQIEDLTRDLADSGYEDVSIEFSGAESGDEAQQDADETSDPLVGEQPANDEVSGAANRAIGNGTLDLRL